MLFQNYSLRVVKSIAESVNTHPDTARFDISLWEIYIKVEIKNKGLLILTKSQLRKARIVYSSINDRVHKTIKKTIYIILLHVTKQAKLQRWNMISNNFTPVHKPQKYIISPDTLPPGSIIRRLTSVTLTHVMLTSRQYNSRRYFAWLIFGSWAQQRPTELFENNISFLWMNI